MKPLLSVNNLSVTYKGDSLALQELSFSMNKGRLSEL